MVVRKQTYDEIDENGKVKRDPKTNKKLWKSSNNREKQRKKVAKVHNHVKNQRKDFGHCTSKELTKDHDLNVFEKLPIQKMMKDRIFSKGIADASWGQVQRFTKYNAEENAHKCAAGKKVDFVDPAYTGQTCSNCGRLVGEEWIDRNTEIFHCLYCKLTINVHVNAARNIRNRSPIYQQKLDDIYRRLSNEIKGKIKDSEKRLISDIYCWSLDPEDSWTEDPKQRINRDAAARIYAFGEVTSTSGQVISWNKEAAPDMKSDSLELQNYKLRPSGRGS